MIDGDLTLNFSFDLLPIVNNFTDTDGTELGNHTPDDGFAFSRTWWSDVGASPPEIRGNTVRSTASGQTEYWTQEGRAPSGNVTVRCVVGSIGTPNATAVGPIMHDVVNNIVYQIRYNAQSGTWQVYKFGAEGTVLINQSAVVAAPTASRVELKMVNKLLTATYDMAGDYTGGTVLTNASDRSLDGWVVGTPGIAVRALDNSPTTNAMFVDEYEVIP